MENENLLYFLKLNFIELERLRKLCKESMQQSLECLLTLTEKLAKMKNPFNEIESIIKKMKEVENGK